MRYITILGEKKKIPAYPHHKDYVYRCTKFFKANNLFSLILIYGVFNALRRQWMQWRYNYAIPLNLLIDPTSACNLKCIGCWAADYDKRSELSFEKLDEIMTDTRKLGITTVLFSGGEPLMRKDDILKLCRKHNQLAFAMFTNGTLIDEAFADEMAIIGNLTVFLSIEGFREKTDFRRGSGTFDKVVAAMDILKKRDIGFGFSVCYHSQNWEEICSDEFLDFLREKGAWFGWMFNYMPVGSGADLSLCLNATQRALVKTKIETYMEKHQFAIIDFANLGHKAFGCVAAGNDFVHINANGDMEPCAFFHYSDVNIHDKPLSEALASNFFKHFRRAKPFSKNPQRPCPIMDVPDALKYLSEADGVHSTHIHNLESMQQLSEKTKLLAAGWKPLADVMYSEMSKKEKRKYRVFKRFLLYRD
jgi:MoaA/NifB/PqqE/SkfB family radical SAM enzyme